MMKLAILKYDFEKLPEIQQAAVAKHNCQDMTLAAMARAGGYSNVGEMIWTLIHYEMAGFCADLADYLSKQHLIQADYNGELGSFEVPLDADVWGEISEILGGDSNE